MNALKTTRNLNARLRPVAIAVGVASMAGVSMLADAEVLLPDDQFLDGSLAATGNPGEIDTTWHSYNPFGGSIPWGVGNNGIGAVDGFALVQGGGAGVDTVAVGSFTPTTLSAAGDSIEVRFNAIFIPDQNPTQGGFEIYLLNDGGTPMTANVLGDGGAAGPRTNNDMVASGEISATQLIPLRTTLSAFVYRLELQGDNSLTRSVTINGDTVISDVELLPATLTFNQLGLLSSAYDGTGFTAIDNIQVVVPEPGSSALVVIGALTMLVRFRRRHDAA